MDATRRRTLGLLLAGLLLALATPGYLAFAHPGLRGYLLPPVLFAGQAAPYLLAAALWLPWRSPPATTIGLGLAGVLLLTAGLLYIPMLTGLVPMGGDMVGLAFVSIAAATALVLVVATLVAHGLLYLRRRRQSR